MLLGTLLLAALEDYVMYYVMYLYLIYLCDLCYFYDSLLWEVFRRVIQGMAR
jgi:hypothetical protein